MRVRKTCLPAICALLAATVARAVAPELAPVPEPKPAARGAGAGARAGAEAAPPTTPRPAEEPAEPAQADAGAAQDGPPAPVRIQPPPIPVLDREAFAACIAALAELDVAFERADAITDSRTCTAPRPLRVTAVGAVELRPPVQARCPVARALGLWVGRVAAPLARLYLDDRLDAVLNGTDYQCRERRGDGSGKISEHAFANAVDVMGFALAGGGLVPVAERTGSPEPERAFQAGVRGGACAFFTTVLGPTTNVAHDDHLHLDMAERESGYRICE